MNHTEPTALVFNIQKFSVHDGPGIRTLVFFKGCPLRCLWCSNPESQNPWPEFAWNSTRCLHCGACVARCLRHAIHLDATRTPVPDRNVCRPDENCRCERCCPGGAIKIYGEGRTISEILDVCRQDELFYNRSGGGLTLGGGEPLFQAEAALALLRAARAARLNTSIETCGHARPEVILDAAACLDSMHFDLKCMDAHKHAMLTGVSNERILANLALVRQHYPELPIRVRTPVIPGCNDSEDNIRAIARHVKKLGCPSYELLPYHRYGEQKYSMLGRQPGMEDADMDKARFDTLREVMEEEMGPLTPNDLTGVRHA